jgi:hypothetical protein
MPFWRVATCLALALALGPVAGCGDVDLPDDYGRRSGPLYGDSVNGTAVLADLCRQRGHDVSSWRYLSPMLERADTIVWFPDDFAGPSEDVQQWLDEWLSQRAGRTLVYVGRDFDAAPVYWQSVLARTPAEKQPNFQRRGQRAEQYFLDRRSVPSTADHDWFSVDGSTARRKIGKLSGPWSAGVDASRVDIELFSRLTFPTDAEVLLGGDQDVLAARLPWVAWSDDEDDYVAESQLVVVANGSFLLNAALVNREHRKLAAALVRQVESCGGTGQRIVFLESGNGGPPIRSGDPQGELPSGLFSEPPMSHVLLHVAASLMVFLLACWPIFGRPRTLEQKGAGDFGRHIDSLAELLEKTRSASYCQARLTDWRTWTRGRKHE